MNTINELLNKIETLETEIQSCDVYYIQRKHIELNNLYTLLDSLLSESKQRLPIGIDRDGNPFY